MRVISIPSPVSFVNRHADGTLKEQEKVVPFLSWLDQVVDLVKDFRMGPKGIKRALKVYDAIEAAGKGPSNVLKLQDADWEAINRTVEETEWTLPNGRRLLPYLEAVAQAAEEK